MSFTELTGREISARRLTWDFQINYADEDGPRFWIAANLAMLMAGREKWSVMDSDDLTPEQAGILYRGLVGGMNYLLRLRTRMEKTEFKPNDPVYQMVCKAYDTMHRLRSGR